MSTGISVAATCSTEWENMKIRHKYKFVTLRIEGDKEVVVDKTGDKDSNYQAFVSSLPADDCRYSLLEVPDTTKIIFIMWTPDSASVKNRMIYASTRQIVLDRISGTTKAIQASDMSDLDEAKIKKVL